MTPLTAFLIGVLVGIWAAAMCMPRFFDKGYRSALERVLEELRRQKWRVENLSRATQEDPEAIVQRLSEESLR